MSGSAREEAERLVATVLARAATAGAREQVTAGLNALGDMIGQAMGGGSGESRQDRAGQDRAGQTQAGQDRAGQDRAGHGRWATGSDECCVCPVCRAIAGMRDPDPEVAERLATGAGEIATGVASLMRAFSSMGAPRRPGKPSAATGSAATGSAAGGSPDAAWSAATRAGGTQDVPVASAGAEGGSAPVAGTDGSDPWAAASAASAAEAEKVRAAQAEERRAAAQAAREAAAAAAKRVAEAAAQAKAAKAQAAEGEVGFGRTPQRFDVWAAATADAGVADVARAATVDHDVPGASAPEDRGGSAGDEARPGDAV